MAAGEMHDGAMELMTECPAQVGEFRVLVIVVVQPQDGIRIVELR